MQRTQLSKGFLVFWVAAVMFQLLIATGILAFAVSDTFGLGVLATDELLRLLEGVGSQSVPSSTNALRQLILASNQTFTQLRQFLLDCGEALLACSLAQLLVIMHVTGGLERLRKAVGPIGS